MKFTLFFTSCWFNKSLPARGEWIEIDKRVNNRVYYLRLSPHGESGLKLWGVDNLASKNTSLSPHGESGLKLNDFRKRSYKRGSLPARGEWIEMTLALTN